MDDGNLMTKHYVVKIGEGLLHARSSSPGSSKQAVVRVCSGRLLAAKHPTWLYALFDPISAAIKS